MNPTPATIDIPPDNFHNWGLSYYLYQLGFPTQKEYGLVNPLSFLYLSIIPTNEIRLLAKNRLLSESKIYGWKVWNKGKFCINFFHKQQNVVTKFIIL